MKRVSLNICSTRPNPGVRDVLTTALVDEHMTEYKLDVSFNSRGTVRIHVFDLDDPEPGPIATCEVGTDLDSDELRQAWGRFHGGFETPDMDEFARENQDADEL